MACRYSAQWQSHTFKISHTICEGLRPPPSKFDFGPAESIQRNREAGRRYAVWSRERL